MYVHDFCPLLSDSHNAVSVDIALQYIESKATLKPSGSEQPKLWNADQTEKFVNSFDPIKSRQLLNRLLDLESKTNICKHDIDNFVNSFNEAYIENCQSSFGTYVPLAPSNNKNKTPRWYTKKCKLARMKFHRAKYLYKLRKTSENKRSLNLSSKSYKKALAEAQIKFKNSKIIEMRNIKTSNPRKFLSFLNNNKKSTNNLSLDAAFEYFININYTEDNRCSDSNIL